MTREVTVSISSPIELASGRVTKADRLIITLVQPPDTPEAILIIWRLKPTVVEPAKLKATRRHRQGLVQCPDRVRRAAPPPSMTRRLKVHA